MKKNSEPSKLTADDGKLPICDVAYRYYNSGNILGVVGVKLNNIKHQEGCYTFLVGRQPEFQWIRTIDLYDSREEAEKAEPAQFYNGR